LTFRVDIKFAATVTLVQRYVSSKFLWLSYFEKIGGYGHGTDMEQRRDPVKNKSPKVKTF